MTNTTIMITLKVDNYKNFTPSFYNNLIACLQFHKLTCPNCERKGCMIIHGYYHRYLKTPYGKTDFRICRVICTECGSTHALLPSAFVPYSQLSLPDHITVIEAFESEGKTAFLLKGADHPDESTFRYVIRQYLKHWKQKLLACRINLRSEADLVCSCFSHYGRQFMQIKRTSNILFQETT